MWKTLVNELAAVAIAATTCLVNAAPVFAQTPSLNGKYTDLIQVINCEPALEDYGRFNDWGYWSGGEVCGEDGEAGYWVYDYPDWYVWGERTDSHIHEDTLPAIASVYETYHNLIQVVPCADDWEYQGDFNEYGYWEGGMVCETYGEPGYWIYVYPNWYVWRYAEY